MMIPFLLAALLISPAASAPAQTFQDQTVYTVKEQGGGLGVGVDQIVLFQLVRYRSETLWVAERRRHDWRLRQRTFQHQWIDSRTCAALDDVVTKIGGLQPLRFAGPSDLDGGWISDIPYVTLIGPSVGGRKGTALMQRDLGGEISKWWWSSQKALAPCWRDVPVLVGDRTVLPKLETDDDAVTAGRP